MKNTLRENREAMLDFTDLQVQRIIESSDDCDLCKKLLEHIEVYKTTIDILIEEQDLYNEIK